MSYEKCVVEYGCGDSSGNKPVIRVKKTMNGFQVNLDNDILIDATVLTTDGYIVVNNCCGRVRKYEDGNRTEFHLPTSEYTDAKSRCRHYTPI